MDCSPIETTKKLVFISKLIQDKRDLKLKRKEKKRNYKEKAKEREEKGEEEKEQGLEKFATLQILLISSKTS
jgi:hypothetical protein